MPSIDVQFYIAFAPVSHALAETGFEDSEDDSDRCRKSVLSTEITLDWITAMQTRNEQKPDEIKALQKLIQKKGAKKVFLNEEIIKNHDENFSNVLPCGKISDQMRTGTCVLHGSYNGVIPGLVSEGRIPLDFEFSETYTWLMHLMEQVNSHFKEILLNPKALTYLSMKDRNILVPNVGEGGWSSYFAFILEKYGTMPASAMPKLAVFKDTDPMFVDLKTSMAKMSIKLSQAAKNHAPVEELLKIKEEGNQSAWDIFTSYLGTPPKTFKIRTSDLDPSRLTAAQKRLKFVTFTPLEYKTYLGLSMKDYVVVSAYPLRPVNSHFRVKVDQIDRQEEGEAYADLDFVNVSNERMMELVKASIDGGEAVSFSSDVGRDFYRPAGILHPDIYNRAKLYGLTTEQANQIVDREELNYFKISRPDHEMAIYGYDVKKPTPSTEDEPHATDPSAKKNSVLKWAVKNSWKIKKKDLLKGKKFLSMYSAWAEQNVYDIFINKKFLGDNELELLRKKPTYVKKGTQFY